MNSRGMTPRPAPGITCPVLLVVAGGAASQAAIVRTAELAAGAPVTVVGVGATEIFRTDAAYSWPAHSPGSSGGPTPRASNEPEQLRRTVALVMSVLENTGVMAMGHIVTGSPARAVARVARARGARVVILDQPGPSPCGAGAAGLVAELRRRMYGSGIVVLAETGRPGGWVSA